MKKILLSIIAITGLVASGLAQCTPDPQFTSSGIYPDSATGLPPAYVGNAYSEVITVIVPADTVIDLGFGPTTIPIVDMTLTGITGLPANFTYACNPGSCVFPGGTSGCVNLYSTQNPTVSDIGLYPLVVNVDATGSTPFGNQTMSQTINYYFIEVLDSAGVNVGVKEFTNTAFKLADIYPNPVANEAKVQFVLGTSEEVTFTVTNLLGKVVERRTIGGVKGVNTLFYATDKLSNGVYMYAIEANGKVAAKRMIVSK